MTLEQLIRLETDGLSCYEGWSAEAIASELVALYLPSYSYETVLKTVQEILQNR